MSCLSDRLIIAVGAAGEKDVLSNKEACEKLLNTPQAKELMKKLNGNLARLPFRHFRLTKSILS